jgi:hypothetical protein
LRYNAQINQFRSGGLSGFYRQKHHARRVIKERPPSGLNMLIRRFIHLAQVVQALFLHFGNQRFICHGYYMPKLPVHSAWRLYRRLSNGR